MSFEARLCRNIILEDFGIYTAKIANLLIVKGRLTIQDLVRFSQYNIKRVRETLVSLIQHGLVFFSEPTDDVKDDRRDATYYEINTQRVMMRLRMGRIMRVTEEHYGKVGSAICQLLFLYGRVKLSQVVKWAATNNTRQKDEAAYVRAFTKMAIEQFVVAALPQHSRSVFDRFLEAEEKEYEKYTIVSSAQEMRVIKSAAQAEVDAVFKHVEHIGMKRKATDELERAAKRTTHDEYAIEDDGEPTKRSNELAYEVDPEVYFALNYEKYNLYFRNHMVADFATSRINRTAGIVMKTFFRSGKDKMKSVKEDASPATTVTHIANMLEPEVFSRGDIMLPKDPTDPKRAPSVNEVVQGYVDLLRADQAGFVMTRDELGVNQYSVNFKKLRETMKRQLLEGLVIDKFGVASCRIIRILLDKGKLDDSQIQKISMLPAKDVRHKLDNLLAAGLVEIQEVPKSADRATARSYHLWYVPIEECYIELLADVYRTIGNLQQRKVEELSRRSRLIDKLSREDVIANIDLLNEIDKAELAKMDKVVERLEVSKGRLDGMTMILRDF